MIIVKDPKFKSASLWIVGNHSSSHEDNNPTVGLLRKNFVALARFPELRKNQAPAYPPVGPPGTPCRRRFFLSRRWRVGSPRGSLLYLQSKAFPNPECHAFDSPAESAD